MRNYEVTFIIDPVLSAGEIKDTAKVYVDHLKNEGCDIIHVDDMGLKQLAYPIKKRNSGIYQCVEFTAQTGTFISKLELALRRDERIIRFLTVSLDKYGVKYNEDKHNGIISAYKRKDPAQANPAPAKPAAAKPAPVKSTEPAPVKSAEPIPVEPVAVKSTPVKSAEPIPVEPVAAIPTPVKSAEPTPVKSTEPIPVKSAEPIPIPIKLDETIVTPPVVQASKSEEE